MAATSRLALKRCIGLERRMNTQRRSESAKKNYARHADLPNKENGNTVKPMVIIYFL
ncbi:MAG: hypothetical protein ACK504_02290 [Bacteroidota bacterium]